MSEYPFNDLAAITTDLLIRSPAPSWHRTVMGLMEEVRHLRRQASDTTTELERLRTRCAVLEAMAESALEGLRRHLLDWGDDPEKDEMYLRWRAALNEEEPK